MRKLTALLLGLVLVCGIVLLTIPGRGYAADDNFWPGSWNLPDSSMRNKDELFEQVFVDTANFHVEDGDSTIDLGAMGYNFAIRSLNAAGDSGSAQIAFGSHSSFFYDDSIARNLDWSAVGLNTANDWLFVSIGSRYIYVRGVVGGTADSTYILEFHWVR